MCGGRCLFCDVFVGALVVCIRDARGGQGSGDARVGYVYEVVVNGCTLDECEHKMAIHRCVLQFLCAWCSCIHNLGINAYAQFQLFQAKARFHSQLH